MVQPCVVMASTSFAGSAFAGLRKSISGSTDVVGPFTLTPRLGLGATVIGPRPLPFDEFSRPVVLLDARAGVRLGAVELTLDVQNLLDSLWRDGEYVFASSWDTASRLPSRHFTAGAPRTLFLNLEVHL